MSKMGLYLAANTLFGSKYMVLQQGYCLAAKTLFGSKDIVWQQGYTNYKVTDMAASMDFASLNLDCHNSPLSNYDRLQV